jgi:hypothetical protein
VTYEGYFAADEITVSSGVGRCTSLRREEWSGDSC